MADAEGRFAVLMVCTGNICRSPVAERLARASWGSPDEIVVTSSGTRAMVDEGINLTMAHLLESNGVYSAEFWARQMTEEHLREADLILGMTRRHRQAALSLYPGAVRRTFTLREFARLAAAAQGALPDDLRGADRLRALVDAVNDQRRPTSTDGDDIRDPYGHPADVHEESFQSIRESVLTVAEILRRPA